MFDNGEAPTNLIEEFMNISDEENKIIYAIKEEFLDLKVFTYGTIVYIQPEKEGDEMAEEEPGQLKTFAHVSELFENYEKIFSDKVPEFFVLKMTKFYVTHDDGFLIVSQDGFGNFLNIFRIKNVLVMYSVNECDFKMASINMRILKFLRKIKLI